MSAAPREHGMARPGLFTVIIGAITAILALAALCILPYQVVMSTHTTNLGLSLSLVSMGTMWKKGLLRKNKFLVGFILLGGIIMGVLLMFLANGCLEVEKKLDNFMQEFPKARLDLARSENGSAQLQQLMQSPVHQLFEELYQQSGPCDMAHARVLWTIIHGLHGVIGALMLLSAIFGAITWFRTKDNERDLEREPLLVSQDSRDDSTLIGKEYEKKRDGPLDVIICAA